MVSAFCKAVQYTPESQSKVMSMAAAVERERERNVRQFSEVTAVPNLG